MIKGILFDKDGTLFDYNATWGAWTLGMLENEAAGDPSVVAQLARVLGYDVENRVFFPDSIVIASTVGELADAILTVVPGDRDALIVRDAGFKLGIATNDAEAPARLHLQRADVERFFDFIAGYDSGYGGKPAPGQMNGFLKAVGLQASECLMVGDSLHDVHAGKAAGMRTVGVLTGPAPREELAPHADVVLNSIAELPNWIASQS